MTRVYGVETEYGLVARSDGRRLPADEAARRLFAPLASRHASTNLFSGNGGRLYLDIGSHPEYATPECLTPTHLVAAQRAGDDLLRELADQARRAEAEAGRQTTFELFRNNVDAYGNTWGSHENYLVARATDPRVLGAWLVPFLASRQLVGGTGRWHRGRFALSQRGDVLGDLVSNQTTRSRPLINTRDEPHADPGRYRRLHVIAGDSGCLEHTQWLVVAVTELVLRLAESGRTPPPGPVDPLDALRAWNHDPDAGVPATDGGTLTARQAQRTHLDLAAGVATDDDETGEAWRAWRALLDDLDAGRPSVAEWDAKRRLLTSWRDRHGLSDADPRLDALDLRWHALGPSGLAHLLQARGGSPRATTDAAIAEARTTAPSASRARARGRLVRAARETGRAYTVDWSSFTVRDLPDASGRGVREATLRLDDPFDATPPGVEDLVEQMTSRPRLRALRGFVPPPGPGAGGPPAGR